MEFIIILAVVGLIVGFFLYASKSGEKLLAEREIKINKADKQKLSL